MLLGHAGRGYNYAETGGWVRLHTSENAGDGGTG